MKIGIDAKWYFTGPVSTRVILQQLLPELIRLYPGNEWVLFLDKKDERLELPFKQKNVSTCYVWANNNMLSNLWVVPHYARRLGVEVMLCQTFPSWYRKIPQVAFIHDVLFREFPQFYSWKERLYFVPLAFLTRRIKRLIATTRFVADDLIKYHYTDSINNVDIVPLAVSNEFKPVEQHNKIYLEKVRRQFNLPTEYILFVGRLNVRKNIENLLKCIPFLTDKQIPVVVVGKEDWKAPHLQQIISSPGIGNRVIMTGSMTNEELIATYAMAKLFCFPSFAEGFGIPPLEAMASGVPVIVSAVTSMPEVCGNAAVYVDPSQPASIATAINRLLEDATLYQQQKELGLERAASFTWEACAHGIMKSITNTYKNK